MTEAWLVRATEATDFTKLLLAAKDSLADLSIRADRTQTHVVLTDDTDNAIAWIGPHRETRETASAYSENTDSSLGTVWTEVLGCPNGAPVHGRSRASVIADTAAAVAAATGGRADRLSTTAPASDAATSDGSAPAARSDQPWDMLSDASAVVFESRPVLWLSPWLLYLTQRALSENRRLVVLTPPHTAVTPALLGFLRSGRLQWVVDATTGMYDGTTGRHLDWQDGGFVETGEISASYAPSVDDHEVMVLEAETTHAYADDLRIGAFTEQVLAAAGAPAPTGFGVCEPTDNHWDTEQLSGIARSASPGELLLVISAPGLRGTLAIIPQPVGVVERLDVVIDPYDASDPIADNFAADALAAGAQIAVLGYRRGTGEGLVPPRLAGPTVPEAAAFGLDRFPTLSDTEAHRLGGGIEQILDDPRALTLRWDLTEQGLEAAPRHPAIHLAELADALELHDSHVRAARARGNEIS